MVYPKPVANYSNQFVDVLSEIASLAVLIVWACECLAFIRYYNWYTKE
jgi:hypothetical protein